MEPDQTAGKDIVQPTSAKPVVQPAPTQQEPTFLEHYKFALIALALVVIAIAIGFGLGRIGRGSNKDNERLLLYGNVDLRQVDLAFNNSERISEVLVQEGDKVVSGQTLARLDTSRLKPQLSSAQAEVDAQQAAVEKLQHGSRPQEIDQARASVESASADQINTKQQWQRLASLTSVTSGRAISQQDLETAKDAMDMAQAHLVVAEKNFDLTKIGPRREDIAAAQAILRGKQAQLLVFQQQLKDAELIAPANAVIRSRMLEPGEMSSPQRPVLNLAIGDPKWIRAYVGETDLGKVRSGMKALVSSDSFPGHALNGWVGFISSVAEFTPKSVETAELRSSLVYEIRVFVQDPQDQMRQGMPATIRLELDPGTRK